MKKTKIHIVLLLLITPYVLVAQTEEQIIDTVLLEENICVDPGPSMATYPGGYDSLVSFINKTVQLIRTDCLNGKVYIMFIVDIDGSLTNAEVIKGLSPPCDQEVLRLVKSLPKKWKPAEQLGKPIKTKMVLPISLTNPK